MAAAIVVAPAGMITSAPASPAPEPIIGLQLGAASFMDEGTDTVLDSLKTRAGVNAIFMSTFCYDRGLNGRQIPASLFPIMARRRRTKNVSW